jgi:hypothetical protein
MFRKIGGIILLVIGVGLGFLFFTSDEFDKQTAGYANAVYLTDNKLVPQNEGKIIIIAGTPLVKKGVVDPLYNIKFDAPFVFRIAQEYRKVPLTAQEEKNLPKGSKNTTKMKWERLPFADKGDSKSFLCAYLPGDLQLGDFSIKGMFLRQLPRKPYQGFTDAFAWQRNMKLQTDDDKLYVTQAQVTNDSNSYRRNGALRFTYEVADMKEAKDITVIGRQKGKDLIYESDEFYGQLYVGKLTKEQVKGKLKSEQNIGTITAVVCCGLMAAGGAYLAFKKPA